MEAKARDLNFLSNEGIVRIPFFQRQYVWGEENWLDLFEDLSDMTRTHFLGSLILKQMPRQSGEPNTLLVIDGQQRLTTLSLLLKALHDALPEENRGAALSHLRPILFYKQSALAEQYLVKIQHSRLDSAAYQMVIRAGIDGTTLVSDGPKSPVVDAYRFFLKKLEDQSVEFRRGLFDHLLNPDNKMLVVIDLQANDNEQAIFDTINSAGVRLSGADIIKNALYQRAIQLLGQDNAVRLYREEWERPFLGDAAAAAFWDEERLTGRLNRTNLEILLHAIAVIDGFYDPDKDTLSDIGSRYKEMLDKVKTPRAGEAVARDISEYARIYREHLGEIDSTTPLTYSDSLARLLHILDVFQVSTLHPFILFVLRTRATEEAHRHLARLERFVVRRIVAGHETKSFNKLAKQLIKDPETLLERLRETTDEDVRTGLTSISNKVAKVVLFWIELRRRNGDKKFDEVALSFNYSLEHIMPQKWSTHWPVPPLGPDGSPVDINAASGRRSNRIYWLGNMTLLSANLNSALQNATFERKIKGEGRKKGMGVYGTLSITTGDVLEPFYAGDPVWDEAKIEARTAALEAEVLAIWGQPQPE